MIWSSLLVDNTESATLTSPRSTSMSKIMLYLSWDWVSGREITVHFQAINFNPSEFYFFCRMFKRTAQFRRQRLSSFLGRSLKLAVQFWSYELSRLAHNQSFPVRPSSFNIRYWPLNFMDAASSRPLWFQLLHLAYNAHDES